MKGASVVIQIGEARSELSARHVVLDQAVDVDDGGGVTELDAGDEDEEERDRRVDGLQHLALPGLIPMAHSRSTLSSLGFGIREREREM